MATEEKRKDQSPNKKQHLKAQNTQWEKPKRKNQVNPRTYLNKLCKDEPTKKKNPGRTFVELSKQILTSYLC